MLHGWAYFTDVRTGLRHSSNKSSVLWKNDGSVVILDQKMLMMPLAVSEGACLAISLSRPSPKWT
jgi:hypothetical protein